ncbi:hypothetical protein ACA910_005563 [Epithemia clementina (nom. ined.)]
MFAKTFFVALFMLLAVATVHVAAVESEGLRGRRQLPTGRENSPYDGDVGCPGYCTGDADCVACCFSDPDGFHDIYVDCTKTKKGGGVVSNIDCREQARAACPLPTESTGGTSAP